MIRSDFWQLAWDGHPDAYALWCKHTNAATVACRRSRKCAGLGGRIVLMGPDHDRLVIWRKTYQGIYTGYAELVCCVNDSAASTFDVVRDAMRWPYHQWAPQALFMRFSEADPWRTRMPIVLATLGWRITATDNWNRVVMTYRGDSP